ncbi:MAG: alpha/beta fold hydrolase [Chloroflexota bacterium]
MFKFWLVMLSTVFLAMGSATAQDQVLPEPQTIQIAASDGLKLVGDFYAAENPSDELKPAVLLLHIIGSDRHSWSPLIPSLLDADYSVLAIDLRGFGDTGGDINWSAATTDVQTWLDWLRGQSEVRPDAISIIGGSIGANLALIGCANDADCVTAIALSPGLVYYSLKPDINQLSKRSALLIASQNDLYPANSVKQMMDSANGDIGARIYPGTAHGTHLFEGSDKVRDGLIATIINWLDEHMPDRD